ncbi:MAG: trypsin-like peptidase domain-containing protein [Gemmataceae bacterium]
MRHSILILALVGGNVLAHGTVQAQDAVRLDEALGIQETLRQIVAEVEPAIACILVSRSDIYARLGQGPSPDVASGILGGFDVGLTDTHLRPFDLAYPRHVPEAFGSGVVIDAAGLILTPYHVVRGATKVYVRLPGNKGSYADIHAADPRSDLAVLRLRDRLPVKALPLGDGDKARKGQLVLSIANPYTAGFRPGSPTASWGIISNIRHRGPDLPKEEDRRQPLHRYGTLWQLDTRLNVTCSGGAVINLQGELIGLTSNLAALLGTETSGGYAIPLDARYRPMVEVLKQGKEVEHGFLGVELARDAVGGPVVIQGVLHNAPAFQAGLRRGDVVLAINDIPLRDQEDLFLTVGALLAGSEVVLKVRSFHDNQVRTLNPARLVKFHVPGPIIASNRPAAVRGLRVDYASIASQGTRPLWGGPTGIPNGVCVREVEPDSPAEAALLKPFAVITAVNGRTVTTPEAFYREARSIQGPLALTLQDSPHDTPRIVKIN